MSKGRFDRIQKGQSIPNVEVLLLGCHASAAAAIAHLVYIARHADFRLLLLTAAATR